MFTNTKKEKVDNKTTTISNEYSQKASNITINENDSKEVKIQKTQEKIELLNKEIEEKQEKIKIELEKLNKLYEEKVIETNK